MHGEAQKFDEPDGIVCNLRVAEFVFLRPEASSLLQSATRNTWTQKKSDENL